MTDPSVLTIGAVARQARVPLDTLRYYERRGLLPAPPRTTSGYRQYPADAVRGLGSPTILVAGRDVTGAWGPTIGRACRADGIPAPEVIVAALAAVRDA